MTSTATIVANSLGNFIIEANSPFVRHVALDAPLHFLVQLHTDILCVLDMRSNVPKQGGAVLRNSTGDLAIVWEETKQLSFSVTN